MKGLYLYLFLYQQAVDHRADASGGHKARGRRRGTGGRGSTSREVTALNRAEQRVRAHCATGVAPSKARLRHDDEACDPAACTPPPRPEQL